MTDWNSETKLMTPISMALALQSVVVVKEEKLWNNFDDSFPNKTHEDLEAQEVKQVKTLQLSGMLFKKVNGCTGRSTTDGLFNCEKLANMRK